MIGTWNSIDGKATSNELPPDVNQMMDIMIDGFKGSVWTFNENGTFRIKFKENLSPVMEEMKFLDNKLWKFDEPTNEVRIGTKQDNYNHLVLTIKKVDSGINVFFSDTPIYLTLTKKIE